MLPMRSVVNRWIDSNPNRDFGEKKSDLHRDKQEEWRGG